MQERLKQVRKSKGLSQKEFGETLTLSQNHISALENGTRIITARIIEDLCKTHNVNKEWFTTGDGQMFNNIIDEFNIDDPEIKDFMEMYVQADSETRKHIKALVQKIIHKTN